MKRASGSPTDWAALRRRLAEQQAALELAFRGQGTYAARLLAERARSLARPLSGLPAEGVTLLLMTGRSGSYALPMAEVSRIMPVTVIVPIPKAGLETLGIVAFDGQIHRLLDLDALFGFALNATPGGHAVSLRHPTHRVALRVEHASDIRQVPLAEFESLAGSRGFAAGLLADGTAVVSTKSIMGWMQGERAEEGT